MRTSSHILERMAVVFDDTNAVANGGLCLPMTLAGRLGLGALVDAHVDLGDAPGRANVGLKAMGLIASALAGGDSIDDADALRSGRSEVAIGQWMPAPSTLGTYLRSFSWGDVRCLDAVASELLVRAWGAGAGPGRDPLTIDVDSTILECYSTKKQGASYGYTKVVGYHPLLASAAGSGEVLGVRARGGNAHTGRGTASFLREVFARVRRAGASGPLVLRADSGFYSESVVDTCRSAKVRYSVTVKMSKSLRHLVDTIPEEAWSAIPYWLEGGADVAETTYHPFGTKTGPATRLIVRRVRPTPGSQLALFTEHSYHAFVTDRVGETLALEADHRRHAEVELVIRDLKEGSGWNHAPSGRFAANAAWLAFGAMAHNLARWSARLGKLSDRVITTPTLRRRYFAIPGHVTRSGRRLSLHLAQAWPWQEPFLAALAVLRGLQVLTT
ncbi:MAG: IS1380 family transposase [Acidimicrobiales bacterium]